MPGPNGPISLPLEITIVIYTLYVLAVGLFLLLIWIIINALKKPDAEVSMKRNGKRLNKSVSSKSSKREKP
jgi:hypothetical protein